MPITIKDMLAGSAQGAAGESPYARGSAEGRVAKLKSLLDAQAAERSRAAGLDTLQKMKDTGLIAEGGGGSVSPEGGVSATRGFNPLTVSGQQSHQAQGFVKLANTEYKPINDQLNASQATLDSLNQKNAASDKLALINEAKLAAGSGGSRAIKGIMDSLTGGKTAAMDFQNTLNYFQNTPNVPTLQPGQRDAIRESVFARLPQLENMHKQAIAKLSAQGPAVSPNVDTSKILNSVASPAQDNLDTLKKMGMDYSTQRQGMGGTNPVSQPATADANPTTLDKLTSFFKRGKQSPSAAAPPQAPGGKIRVKHVQSGQVGTIDSTNPQDMENLKTVFTNRCNNAFYARTA